MRKIKGYKSQYSSLKLMKELSQKNILNSFDFVKEMKKLGYVSPRTYLFRYLKKGILKKVNRGRYLIIK